MRRCSRSQEIATSVPPEALQVVMPVEKVFFLVSVLVAQMHYVSARQITKVGVLCCC